MDGEADTLSRSGPRGMTASIVASIYCRVDAISCLMDHGADLASRWSGVDALFEACYGGHLQLVKVVIEKGMDIDGRVTLYWLHSFGGSFI